MRDGQTKKLDRAQANDLVEFLEHRRARLVQVSGAAAGQEFVLGPSRVTIGRGPGVDIAIAEETLSRQHAAIEFAGGRFRVEDLGSTNGLQVNGEQVQCGELEHGDHLRFGSVQFQLLIEERETVPDTYELPAEP